MLLDLLMLMIALMLVTQVLLPMIMPSTFKMFWFFKKRKSLSDRVEKISTMRDEVKLSVDELKNEADKSLYEDIITSDKISDMENDNLTQTKKQK